MVFTFPSCGGCTSCELACSYRATGEFNRNRSAIEVTVKEDGGYLVELHDKISGQRAVCDGCVGEEEPMCIKYCHDADALMECVNKRREAVLSGGEDS